MGFGVLVEFWLHFGLRIWVFEFVFGCLWQILSCVC